MLFFASETTTKSAGYLEITQVATDLKNLEKSGIFKNDAH